MINYLFSDINKAEGFNKNQIEYLKKDLTGNESIVFIASIPSDFEKNDFRFNTFVKHFTNAGFTFKNVVLIDKRMSNEQAKEEIQKADIVFLIGGDPFSSMQFINEYGLKDAISQASIVIGTSAGSMIQSKRVMYSDDYDDYKIVDFEGLGLVDINIFPHVDDERIMKEAVEIGKIVPNIPLLNSSFVRVENGKVEIVEEEAAKKKM